MPSDTEILGPAQLEGANSAAERSQRAHLVAERAGGMAALARKSGVPQTTIHRVLNGGEMKAGVLVAIAAAAGVRLEWLATGTGPMRADGAGFAEEAAAFAAAVPRPAPSDDVLISRYDARTAAGLGTADSAGHIVEKVLFSADFIRNKLRRDPKNLALIECSGDSMEPALRDGDDLLVDTSVTTPRSGPIYILRVGGALLAKRVQPRMDGTVMILSDNPRYPPETITPSEATPLDVVGEVLWRSGTLR